MSSTRYYRRLAELIDLPAALALRPSHREAIAPLPRRTPSGPLRGPTRRSGVPVTALTLPAPRRRTPELVLRTAARGAVLDRSRGRDRHRAAPGRRQGWRRGQRRVAPGDAGQQRVHDEHHRRIRPTARRRPGARARTASGLSNAAGTKANELRGLGYAIAGTGNAARRPSARPSRASTGFEKEADALAKAVGAGATVTAYPDPPPSGSENADCIVTLGTSQLSVVQPAAASWSASQSRLVRAAARSRSRSGSRAPLLGSRVRARCGGRPRTDRCRRGARRTPLRRARPRRRHPVRGTARRRARFRIGPSFATRFSPSLIGFTSSTS